MSKQVTLYGIPNCDTVKKARTWLDANGVAYTFHDFKKAGLDAGLVKTWLKDIPWDTLVNRKGTTWRKLSDDERSSLTQAKAIRLMQEHPSVIKRPLLDTGTRRVLGFSETDYKALL